MIRLTPRGRFSWSFDITQSNTPIGSLDLARLKRSGSFTIGAQSFELKPDGFLGPLALENSGRIIARAKRAFSFRTSYRVQADDHELELRGGLLLHKAVLAHGDVVVARLRRPNFFRRVLEIELLQNAPLPLLVFVSAVIILYWRQASRSS
jgi:hypothetical protein